MRSKEEKHILKQLPQSVTRRLYLEFLFRDFLYTFKVYFRMNDPLLSIKGQALGDDSRYKKFIVQVCHNLEPRIYKNNKVIQEQFHEVYEMLFITEGSVRVGYRLFNETHYGKMLEKKAVVNDYSCAFDKCSEFLYTAFSAQVKGYAIRKNSFLALTKQKEIGTAFVNFIEKTYVGNFQRPLNEHRQEQIQRNAHRIDYINLQALGMMEIPVQPNGEQHQSQNEN